MVLSKRQKLVNYLAVLFLVLFPFGQLIRIETNLLGGRVRVHPIEVLSLLALIILFTKKRLHKYPKTIVNLILFGAVSLIFSLSLFEFGEILGGAMYYLRAFSFLGVYLLFKNTSFKYEQLKKYFVLSLFVAGLFGWIQYFLLPDLRFIKFFGWDDHYFRLAGTFLDPGYTGLLMVFGGLMSLEKYLATGKKREIMRTLFFAVTVLFTYSRASYLALIFGILYLFIKFRKTKILLVVLSLFAGSLFFLPRGDGEGVNLKRSSSIFARVVNYSETIQLFKQSPVFGVGFNNICAAREKFLGSKPLPLNSCFGSDSSLLMILTTTGVVGFMVFIHSLFLDSKKLFRDKKTLIYSLSISLFIHSLFVNSMFYPWVYGSFIAVISKSYRE